MKFLINIDQRAIVESGLDLDITDAAILDCLRSFSASQRCRKIIENGSTYYWISYQLISDDLPIIRLKKDSMYRRFKKMVGIGLILPHEENQSTNQSWYKFTQLFDKITYGYKSEPTDTNPSHRIVIREPTDFHPTTKDTNIVLSSTNTSINTEEGKKIEKVSELKVAKSSAHSGGRAAVKSKPLLTRFDESELGDFEKFNEYIKDAYPEANPDYYFNKIKRWSIDREKKKANWKITVGVFVRGDFEDGKLITTNHQGSGMPPTGNHGKSSNLQSSQESITEYADRYFERKRQRQSEEVGQYGSIF